MAETKNKTEEIGVDMSKTNIDKYKELEKTHGKVHILKVPLDDEKTKFAILFLKSMTRTVYSMVSKMLEKDELQATEVLINSLWIGGDDKELVTKDFEALHSASFVCGKLLKPREAELKKN